jgi:hypothetical protein
LIVAPSVQRHEAKIGTSKVRGEGVSKLRPVVISGVLIKEATDPNEGVVVFAGIEILEVVQLSEALRCYPGVAGRVNGKG